MKRWDTLEGGTIRAPRYRVKRILEYRIKTEREWSQAISEDFSRSGISFSRPRSLPLETQIVIRVPMPLQDGRIVCDAKIVRDDALKGLTAVAILKYRFERTCSIQPYPHE